MSKPSILIVEDSDATRKRLEQAITQGGQFDLCMSVADYASAENALFNNAPDILLTDIHLPDGSGIDLIRHLQHPEVSTKLAIVISIFGDGEHVIDALKAGASGYLLKDDSFFEINEAISQMLKGGSPISPSIARHLLTELQVSPENVRIEELSPTLLTKREHEVLVLVSKGYTSKEISKLLDLSYHTIKEYVSNIYRKLAVNNRMQAVYEATIQGII